MLPSTLPVARNVARRPHFRTSASSYQVISVNNRRGIINRYLNVIIVLLFMVIVVASVLSSIWSADVTGVQRDAAGEELEALVNNQIDPECSGPGEWTDYNSNFGLQDNIERVVFEDGRLNATLEGDAGHVSHRVNACEEVQICDPGEDVDPQTKQCPHSEGYIPGGSPSVHIWAHPDANFIIIDPDT